jgi:hypothetical protein
MMAAAAAKRGNHRRTKSTHPDELNKMMLSLSTKEDNDQPHFDSEESKEPTSSL